MLKIQKREDVKGYEKIISSFNLDLYTTQISEAVNGDTVDGYIIYSFGINELIIYDYNSNNDLYLTDGLVRSILFIAALKGIETARFECKDKSELIRLKFISEESNVLYPISSKFGGCEGCKK